MRKRIKDRAEGEGKEDLQTDSSADDKYIKRRLLDDTNDNGNEITSAWPASTICMIIVILLGAGMVGFNTYELRALRNEQVRILEQKAGESSHTVPTVAASDFRPKVQIWSPKVDMKHLRHVSQVFERLGFRFAESTNDTDWDVLWAHDYPFNVWQQTIRTLKPHQKVNHFPGTGYVTTKVSLATSGGPHIPPAFKIPEDKENLMEYVSTHPDSLFVEKSNDHREVKLRAISELNFNGTGSFVQEFMSRPLLISGHKFDIGVYTIVTSIDPLRIYKFDGDVLFRFCLEAYEPFNSSNVEQYVIGEDYLPAWQVPDLQEYSELSFSRKEAFDAHLRSSGQQPERIWSQIDDAISSVYLRKENLFTDLLARYGSKRSFFEMVRFDFIVDEDLTVYMLEANMSPNLSSLHYPPNGLMYEQVLYNLLALVGVASYLHPPHPISKEAKDMMAFDRNIMVFPDQCVQCEDCEPLECKLCRPCMGKSSVEDLKMAYSEHLNRQRCKRVYPPPMTQEEARRGLTPQHQQLSIKNQIMLLWFQGKCILDVAWCQ